MANVPLFIKDLDTLKARLRLSAVDTGDATDVLDSVIEEVRVGFYSELSITRVAEIVLLASENPAVTEDGILKLRAENIELLWVRVTLMRRLPMLFVQGSGQTRKAWNEEGITRDARDTTNYRNEIKHLDQLVRNGINWLDENFGQTGDIITTVIEPDVAPPRPGATVWGVGGIFNISLSSLVPIEFTSNAKIFLVLAPVMDTWTDSAQASDPKGNPDVGGPAINLSFQASVVSTAYMHLRFDLSAFDSLHSAKLTFHINTPSAQPHDWEIRRMSLDVIERQSTQSNIDQQAVTPWPTGGADGGFADTVITSPIPITGTAPANLVQDSKHNFADILPMALDAIANHDGILRLFIWQPGPNTATSFNIHSTRVSPALEPKLEISHTPAA